MERCEFEGKSPTDCFAVQLFSPGASWAVIVRSEEVFLDCPFLDCLIGDVTASTVDVTSFTNHCLYQLSTIN